MGLIGRRWKLCEGWSRPVLIGRGLAHIHVVRIHCVTLSTSPRCGGCSVGLVLVRVCWIVLSVVFAEGVRPVPSRTRKLSPPAPMVLHSSGCGRVGRRRHSTWIEGAPPVEPGRAPFVFRRRGSP